MKVIAAMSGGVDSAVAAARLIAAGHEVIGVHLALAKNSEAYHTGGRGCCTLSDVADARRAADVLGIPFYIWDFSDRFEDEVVADFVSEYAAGRTPNPCLRCNEKIKFAALVDRAVSLGFDAVGTGHYAIRHDDGTLYRAADLKKDQSYVLGVLRTDQLRHCLFPLGDTVKADIRTEARQLGLRVADKPDSTDICFIPDGDTAGFLRGRLGNRTGLIVDESGTEIGTHDGYYQYTIGQRRGLHLSRPGADGQPRYVFAVDPVTDSVSVGPKSALRVAGLAGIRLTWATAIRDEPWTGFAQVRAHGQPLPARFSYLDDELIVEFDIPVFGIAPGQACVCYAGDQVIGSATIARTW